MQLVRAVGRGWLGGVVGIEVDALFELANAIEQLDDHSVALWNSARKSGSFSRRRRRIRCGRELSRIHRRSVDEESKT